jgi:hypothetical protein
MPISRAMINKELRNKGGAVKKKKKKKSKKNWIQGAVKKPGALRKKLGVAKGKKISESQLNKAAKSKNPTTRRQANLAKTFKKMNRRRG